MPTLAHAGDSSVAGDAVPAYRAPGEFQERLSVIRSRYVLTLGFAALLVAPLPSRAQQPDSVSASPALADTVPQKDVTDVLRSILKRPVKTEVTGETKRGLSFTLLPSLGYNPAYGAFVGASVAVGGWLGDPKTTTLSAGSISGSYAFEGQ